MLDYTLAIPKIYDEDFLYIIKAWLNQLKVAHH